MRRQLLTPLIMRNRDQSGRSIGGIVAAALITFWVLAQPISSAQATTISVEAAFSGRVIGFFNGTDYVGPLGHCDPSSNSPCSHTFLPSTATVTGTVTETPGMFNFGNGPVPAITTTQSFQGSGAFGSFTTTTSSVTPGSSFCDLFCLSVNGLGGTTATGSPVTGSLGLQPNYSGAPLNATTLPIVYPFNFTSDGLSTGASGGTFQSGNLGFQPANTCAIFGGSVDGMGRCNVGSVRGFATTSPLTPPPTVLQLERMNADFYNNATPTGVGPYSVLATPATVTNGFAAVAYVNGDPNNFGQIVVIPQATAGHTAAQAAYEFLADTAFVNGQSNTALNSQVQQFADFLKNIAQQYPTSQITVSGYSLGGGIAQIVGQYAGVQTVTFDLPGAAQFLTHFSSLSSLGSLDILSPSVGNWDYRYEGDQVSFVGTQVGQSMTVINPLMTNSNGVSTGSPRSIFPQVFADQNHALALMDAQLISAPEMPGDTSNPSIVIAGNPDQNFLNQIVDGAFISLGVEGFHNQIQNAQGFAASYDPGPGYDYSLVINPGSPNVTSLLLPVGIDLSGDNVGGWCLIFGTQGGLSGSECSTSGLFSFTPGVDTLDFHPIDPSGDPIFYSDPFIFALTFDGPGTFDATLTTSETPVQGGPSSSVPEPPSIILFLTFLAAATLLSTRVRQNIGGFLSSRGL